MDLEWDTTKWVWGDNLPYSWSAWYGDADPQQQCSVGNIKLDYEWIGGDCDGFSNGALILCEVQGSIILSLAPGTFSTPNLYLYW